MTDCPCTCHTSGLAGCSINGGCYGNHQPAFQKRSSTSDLDGYATETVQWLTKLQGEIDQPAKRDINTQAKSMKVTGSPAPWNTEAAGVITTIEASARLHARVLRRLLGHTDHSASASTEVSRAAIHALPALIEAASAHPAHVDEATRELKSWPRTIRAALDAALPGETRLMTLDPRCPYCGEHSLKVPADGSEDVTCYTPWCHSHDGVPCTNPQGCTVTYDRLRYRWERKDWTRLLDQVAAKT